MFSDGLPLKPGGILKPSLGPKSGLRRGAVVPSKKMNKKKKRPNKGKPAASSPPPGGGGATDFLCESAGLPFVGRFFFLNVFLLGTTAPLRKADLGPTEGFRIPPGFRGRPSENKEAK